MTTPPPRSGTRETSPGASDASRNVFGGFRASRARVHEGDDLPGARAVLAWRFDPPIAALSSAPVGGGAAALDWIVNIGVDLGYARTDIDVHVADVARQIGCTGTGAGLLTAADVRGVLRREDGGVTADVTVGISKPTWAADVDAAEAEGSPTPRPGTINAVIQVPVGLTPAAAVNAVITATEAKTQALLEAGVPGTGTASDAVVVCWPPRVPAEPFAGPRSTWGARIARAVHAAVADGLRPGPAG